MVTIIVMLAIAAGVTFLLVKSGKLKDDNGNNEFYNNIKFVENTVENKKTLDKNYEIDNFDFTISSFQAIIMLSNKINNINNNHRHIRDDNRTQVCEIANIGRNDPRFLRLEEYLVNYVIENIYYYYELIYEHQYLCLYLVFFPNI